MAFVENRSTQALDTQPNLPFAQEYPIHTQADIPINFGQSLSLASLSRKTLPQLENRSKIMILPSSTLYNPSTSLTYGSRKQQYYDYIVNGDHWTFGKMVNKKVRWTESNAQQYRNKGYDVVKVEDSGGILKPKPTPTTTGGGTTSNGHGHVFETLHPKQTKQLIKIGVDTTKLGKDTTVLGKKLTEAKIERDRIEAKVNANKDEHQDFHDKLDAIGQAMTQHNVGHDVGGGLFGGGMIALAVIGVGAYFLLRRKK